MRKTSNFTHSKTFLRLNIKLNLFHNINMCVLYILRIWHSLLFIPKPRGRVFTSLATRATRLNIYFCIHSIHTIYYDKNINFMTFISSQVFFDCVPNTLRLCFAQCHSLINTRTHYTHKNKVNLQHNNRKMRFEYSCNKSKTSKYA